MTRNCNVSYNIYFQDQARKQNLHEIARLDSSHQVISDAVSIVAAAGPVYLVFRFWDLMQNFAIVNQTTVTTVTVLKIHHTTTSRLNILN